METPNNITDSILKSNDSSISDLMSSDSRTTYSTSGTSGIFDTIQNISVTTWIIIILVLAFLGFNVFIYLAKGTNDLTDFLQQIAQKVIDLFLFISDTIIHYTSQGVETVVDTTANTITNIEGEVEGKNSTMSGSKIENTTPQEDVTKNNTMNQAINTSQKQHPNSNEYEPNEAQSSVASSGNSGWCFVGKDEGYRTCMKVSKEDVCMSGDIFPSQEICINPSLRT